MDNREAAAARGASLSHGDRPKKRSASSIGLDKFVRAEAKLEVRAPAEEGEHIPFTGRASATERGYQMYDFFGPYTEVMAQGAFEKTLGSNPNVPLVLGHDSLRRIASTENGTLQLSEDDEGLLTLAQLDPTDADVAYIVPKIRSGLQKEMSFRFSIVSSQWSPDYTELRITEVDIDRGDVSIVGFGANPHTSAELRSAGGYLDWLQNATEAEVRAAEVSVRMRLREFGKLPGLTIEEILKFKP
jgi:HK97 family phage prohead protease